MMAAPHGTSWRRENLPSTPDQKQLLDFAARAAHDIVGPVDQVSSLVALFVQRYRGRLDNDADTLLSHIETARSRLRATAAGLRKCFQVSTAPCERTAVDLNLVLESALDSLAGQIAECGAEVHIHDLPALEGDRDLLVLLFQCILENALKFRQEGVPARVEVSAVHSSENVIYQVSDNGIGIDPQYHEAVFQSFKKLNGHAYPGAGLGLTIARFIVEHHGGSIWIEPAPQGTQVRFRLTSVVP